ncbi:MAG: hypothetical protein DMD83_04715 [Candidatus Rokuibacteriota bacterium]|nr:MAG: hypothetical protein DMD83_04715 [Candidatus Rokubacteria bacterium]
MEGVHGVGPPPGGAGAPRAPDGGRSLQRVRARLAPLAAARKGRPEPDRRPVPRRALRARPAHRGCP